MVQVSYWNSYGKVLKNDWMQVDPLVHKWEWKSSLGIKSVNNNPQRIRPIAVSYFARKIQEEEGLFF